MDILSLPKEEIKRILDKCGYETSYITNKLLNSDMFDSIHSILVEISIYYENWDANIDYFNDNKFKEWLINFGYGDINYALQYLYNIKKLCINNI
jgi:hypothetical protein